MSAGGSGTLDFRAKFLKLLGYAVVAAAVSVVLWGIVTLGVTLFGQAKHLRCQENLKEIVRAMWMYRTSYHDLPPYLTALLPQLEDRRDKLQCPADPNRGEAGSRPSWLRAFYTDRDFANCDLDGPTLNPRLDKDTIPCSYLYAANAYPCPFSEEEETWRDYFERLVREHGRTRGRRVPLIRCYYHLPHRVLKDEQGQPYPDPAAAPTYNVTRDNLVSDSTRITEYQLDWANDPRFQQ